MTKLNKLQSLTFELDEIESIEPVGYRNCTDISVADDSSFCLANGIVSHNSAMTGISQALGRDGIAYYAGRGVPLNVWKAKLADMQKNKEFMDIMTILGIDPTKGPAGATCGFDKIVHANDADCFAGNTLVSTDSGLKPIKEITYEDKVLGSDGEYHPILEIQEKHTNDLMVIHVGNDTIITTPTQEMFVARKGEVIKVFAKDIQAGDMLLKRKNEKYDPLPITEVNRTESPIEETLYDITTDGDHTFFIYLPNSGDTVLVHNCDGIHICEIYLGWWMKLIPDLFNQKRICRLVTPLAVLYSDSSKSKVIKYFFSLAEYKQYETKYPDKVKRGKVNYYKGLGSWGKSEFQKLFASSPNGIEDFLEPIVFDEKPKDEDILDSWLSDKWADRRKDYLRNYNLDINQV